MKIVKNAAAACEQWKTLLEALDEDVSQEDATRFFEVVSTELAD